MHVDLGDLPHGGYLSTVIDERTRFLVVAILQRESEAEFAVCNCTVRVPDRLAFAVAS
jgi:hypothetical protein